MASKYIDISAVTQVIGSVLKNPQLLDQDEKYWFIEDDFSEEFHKIVFGTIHNLHQMGVKQISINAIVDYLSSRPHNFAVFEAHKGEEYLLNAAETAQLASFDYHYNRVKKMTLLRAYDKIGFDLSPYYDIDNILDIKKKEEQENWLDNTSLEGIANTIDSKISEIRDIYVNDDYSETMHASKGILNLVDKFKQTPEIGIPLYGPLINTVTRGARLKKLYLRSAPSGYGKAIPNYTFIPTPTGFKRVGDIKPGDYLFGQDGKPTKVIQIHPQPEPKEIWKVTFEDGRVAECCKDHLWEYGYKDGNNYIYKVESTEDIFNKMYTSNSNFVIKLNRPVDYSQLDSMGSIEQRFESLQDLLDLHGDINVDGDIIFQSNNCMLIVLVICLCQTLGFIALKKENMVIIKCPTEVKPFLFKSENRIKKVKESILTSSNSFDNHLRIVSIERTKELTNMTCFTVDNEDHLFLMNDYIVTHNTRANVADACNFACNKIYDETFGWISNGKKNPTLFIATEQDLEEIQTLMLAFISNVNEAHILDGEYEEGEEERVRKAAEIIADSPLYVKECPDFSIKDIENTIKKEIREHDVSYIVFDYLQTSMKILEEITRRSGGVRLREDNILFMFSSKLKDICNLYGVFIITGTQLSAEWRESKTPDQNLLRGAKAIADKIDMGCHILPVSEEDLKALSGIIPSFPQAPNNKISIYKNRRGAYKGIYLWSNADLGTCRIKPMFATDWSYNLISIDDVRVQIEEEESAF